MRTIGILGGLGPESTASLYRRIHQLYHLEHEDFDYPEVVIVSISMGEARRRGYHIGPLLHEALTRLRAAGADFGVAACNTAHLAHAEVAPNAAIPWIGIHEVVADAVAKTGCGRVGLLGTRITMSADFYRSALSGVGAEVLVPDEEAQASFDRFIFERLVSGLPAPEAAARIRDEVQKLHQRGADGVILGCTELGLHVHEDLGVRVFDSTELLARCALELALDHRPLT